MRCYNYTCEPYVLDFFGWPVSHMFVGSSDDADIKIQDKFKTTRSSPSPVQDRSLYLVQLQDTRIT